MLLQHEGSCSLASVLKAHLADWELRALPIGPLVPGSECTHACLIDVTTSTEAYPCSCGVLQFGTSRPQQRNASLQLRSRPAHLTTCPRRLSQHTQWPMRQAPAPTRTLPQATLCSRNVSCEISRAGAVEIAAGVWGSPSQHSATCLLNVRSGLQPSSPPLRFALVGLPVQALSIWALHGGALERGPHCPHQGVLEQS